LRIRPRCTPTNNKLEEKLLKHGKQHQGSHTQRQGFANQMNEERLEQHNISGSNNSASRVSGVCMAVSKTTPIQLLYDAAHQRLSQGPSETLGRSRLKAWAKTLETPMRVLSAGGNRLAMQ